MKKYFIIALAAVALTACKKDDTSTAPVIEQGELQIQTKANGTKALLPNYHGNGDNFFPLDELGFFMAAEVTNTEIPADYKFWTSPVVVGKAKAANYGYVFGTPYWVPLKTTAPNDEKLKYQKDAAVQLFAYFPRQNSDNALTTNPLRFPATLDGTTLPELKYTIPADQSDPKILRMADLMWSKNTGETANKGFTLSSKPVTMTFTHLMSRVNFGIKIFNSQNVALPAPSPDQTFSLRAVIVNGNQINSSDVVETLNVVNGKLTYTKQAPAYNGQVYFFDNGVAGAFTALVKAENKDLANAVPFTAAAVTTMDMLIHPFKQELTKNSFIFIFSDDTKVDLTEADKTTFATKYPTVKALQDAVIAGDAGLYRYSYDFKGRTENTAAIDAPNNGAWLFDAGVNNQMVVSADVSSKVIDIITKITPWVNLDPVDVPAE